MADIVLGIGTSHTPLLTLPADLWPAYARRDERNPELAYPPHGQVMSYQEALDSIAPEVRAKYRGSEPFREQAETCQRALDELSRALREHQAGHHHRHRRRPGRVVLRGQHAGPGRVLGRHRAR